MGVERLLPPRGIARTLAAQSMIYAIGNGVFIAGSAVFFVHVVGLTPTQVGIGLSVAGALTLLLSVPVGGLTDRLGARRTWLVSTLAEAVLFGAYPFVRGFWAFLVVVSALAVTGTAAGSGRSVYSIEAIPRQQRVRVLAFSRSALNIGFTVGVLAAGVVLTVDTRPAYYVMVLANAAGLLGSAACVARLPSVPRVPAADRPGGRLAVLRDRPFLAVTVLCGVLLSYGTLMTEVIPLWVITRTNAPRVMLAVLFAINTVMVVALQVLATRGTETLPGAARVLRRCGLAAAVACPVVYLTRITPVPVTIALLVLTLVLITGAELWQSAGAWGVSTELAPADRRGEYLGVFRLGPSAQSMVGPAALTWLAIGTGGWGWLPISALFVVAALAAGPVVAWAGRTPRGTPVPA